MSRRRAAAAAAGLLVIFLCTALVAPARASSRNLLLHEAAEIAVKSALRGLTAYSGTSCPATGYTRAHRTSTTYAPPSSGGTDPLTNGVPFASLHALGWAVPITRTPATSSADFWSVICNSWGNAAPNRQSCAAVPGSGNNAAPPSGVGEVHLRYDCSSQTLWMLTYAYATYNHTQDTTEMFAVYDCTTGAPDFPVASGTGTWCKNAGGSDSDKFMQFAAAGTNGCNKACPTTNNGFCTQERSDVGDSCWCCLGMWPVTEEIGGITQFVGWLGRARFSLPATKTAAYSVWSPHINWGNDATASKTGSAGSQWVNNGVCLDCGAILPPEDACPPPALTNTAASPVSVCTTQAPTSLTFNITSSASGTVTLVTTPTDGATCIPASTAVTVTADAVSPVTFTCTQASGSGYSVSVVASQTTQDAVCGTLSAVPRSASASVTGSPSPPTLSVTGPGPEPQSVCSDAVFKELTFSVASSGATPSVQVTEPTFCQAVAANGAAVTVNCTRPATGWPTGQFDVRLNASASAPPCAVSASDVATVAVKPNPDIAITPPSSPSVCANAAWKVFSFSVQASVGTTPLTATVLSARPAAICTAGQPSAAGVVLVNCTAPSNGWTAFDLGISVQAATTDGCTTTADSAVARVAVDPTPTVSINGPSTASMCAQSGSPLTYTITSSTGGATVTATGTDGVACTTATTGTTATVTCSKLGGLPATFTVTVTASTVNATSSCLGEAVPLQTSVAAFCCGSGTAYARGNFAPASSGLNSSSTCFIPSLGNNWGWFSRLSGPGTGAYPLIMGAGQCKGGTQVGTVRVSCEDRGTFSRVTFDMAGQTILGGVTPHAYVGCTPPTVGTPPSFGGSRAFAFASTTGATATNCTATPGCGDNVPAVVSTPQAMQLNCTCRGVYWVFHQSSSFFTYSRTNGACA